MSVVRRGLVAGAAGAATLVGARVVGRRLVARTEARLCLTGSQPPRPVSDKARDLHRRLWIADLHADSLLWGRDLLDRSGRGQVDVPRLIDGNVALQVLAVTTQSPRHINLERNDDRSDDVILLALALGWPPATWRCLLPRALHLAHRADDMAARADGRFRIIRSRADLADYEAARRERPAITAALLSIEGAHALDGDPANVEVVADAGFRMMSPSHFFDNAFGGSAHGIEKGGLTERGREMVERMEARRMLVDVAHASVATVDDVLALATRPVVASHTGLRGCCDNVRNLSDEHARGIAATGGVLGIGFWPTACGGEDVDAIARSVAYAVDVAGAEHVALGSDFDGAVPVPFDATGMIQLTEALLGAGLDEPTIAGVMGGNVRRLLAEALPDR
ncbi:MAG TPA: membrane dipeptidase [Candidatus Limnocylindrales bacterium]|nr:membrane dipeptidase [Candidatus Limnocylindrales bacterium]